MTSGRVRSAPRADRLSTHVDAVLRASRALVGIAAESLTEVDDIVTPPQWRVLVLVYTRGPLNLAAVAAALDVNPSNASRTCDRLLKAGLLDRRESEVDRRNVTLTLTQDGRQLVERVTDHRRKSLERVLRKMKPAERAVLAEAMAGFADAAGEPDIGAGAVSLLWPPAK
ncbi:MarR family winged helix-turn-helix transcriptional regulator [Mycobacterium sp. WMMD1722]|uniref:MarR family winged helix-turn-helix transcriptional regulator n=1 Tax=Mycobacterium sp. WMMD1722 TaxID=3404117 RepID=UPI003BF5BBB4